MGTGLRRQIRKWMREHYQQHIDECDEVNCTALAEACAFDLNHPEWLDDDCHEVWDVAVDIAKEYEEASDENT